MNNDAVEERFKKAQDSLVLQSSDLSLETIAEMVEKDAIDIEPEYQRRERWSHEKQSALIESFILNVPIPPVYLAENDYGNYSVIDGKQRITAIHLFMKKGMKLNSLENFREIERATLDELPRSIQNALKIRPYVRVVTLLKQSDPNLKYEVFTRLNTGGEPLLSQEIRNVAYRGPVNSLVYGLAENDFLRQQMKIRDHHSKPYRNMMDAEYVLRFFTLLEEWQEFSGVMRVSMDRFMQKHQHEKPAFVDRMRDAFERAISGCRSIWGTAAFKRHADGQWRNLLLAGMYDAQMLGVALLTNSELDAAKAAASKVRARTVALLKDDATFDSSVRQFTSNPERLRYRIEKMVEMLRSV